MAITSSSPDSLLSSLLPPKPNGNPITGTTSNRKQDGGAVFVLESKGDWWHAGFHLTTAIVGPSILALPYVFRGLGWILGFICLTVMGVVTFYSYYLMSKVLELCENQGRRHIRFRELASDVLGSGGMFYFVIFIQTAVNTGITIGTILLSADSIKILYSSLVPDGPLKLYHFIMMVTFVMILLSQLPSFHSLRYINFGSLLLSLGYTSLVVGACIHAGSSKNAPPKDYTLNPEQSTRAFDAFTSISIVATILGNGIFPEIQATMAPPATGKMVKGLIMCYTVIVLTFYSTSVSGYWAFGNQSSANILRNLLPDDGPALVPTWVMGLIVMFVILQLLPIGLVYSQVAYEILETQSANVKEGMYSKRNLTPRLLLRSLYMIFCAFVAAMLPFFGDINGIIGGIGFIPLDFILPMLMYNMTHKPTESSLTYWINIIIMVVFSGVGIMGTFSSVRSLILDATSL
ncbi:hypothetical protein MKW92_021422 [Papaver armeniacum]|nr:hypothetical protein MKW92_021422 [Papaver armeniacum]